MAQKISRRHRRLLTRASRSDIWRIVRDSKLQTPAHVDLLIERVEELANIDPEESYELGAKCLLPVFDRAEADFPRDVIARGLLALGQASRRLGRLREAERFYERAWSLKELERTTWTKLCRRRAVLAMDQRAYRRAEQLSEAALRTAGHETDRAAALIVRGIVRADQNLFAIATKDLRSAMQACAPNSPLQWVALANLARIAFEMGDRHELVQTGLFLVKFRERLRGYRSTSARKIRAHVNWLEGKVLIRLGVQGRIVLRRLRQGALGLVRLKILNDALFCADDILEYANENGQTRAVLEICQEILSLANEVGAETHFETRALLQVIVDSNRVSGSHVEAFREALAIAA